MGWSEDKCVGGTPDASSEGGGTTAAGAFDDSIETASGGWQASGSGGDDWIGYDFGSGNEQQIEKVRMCQGVGAYISYMPDEFYIRGSNTGFESDSVDLEHITGAGSWTEDVWREWEFTNSNSYRYVWVYVVDSVAGSYVCINEIEFQVREAEEGEVTDSFTMSDSVDAETDAGEVTDSFTMSDEIDAVAPYADFDESFSMSDEVDGGGQQSLGIDESFDLSDSVDAFSLSDSLFEAFGVSDTVDGERIQVGYIVESFEIGDSIDAFNYSEWIRENQHKAVKRFHCTLTGAADGLSDVEIPIKSFQARRKSGEPSYLSVVVPGYAYADAINDRSNGQLVIDMAFIVDGSESLREEIIRVDLEDISISKGARNRSFTLSGHRTETFGGNSLTLENPTYRLSENGKLRYRFALPDLYLNPGDSVTVGDDSLTVDEVSYFVSIGRSQMEIAEA